MGLLSLIARLGLDNSQFNAKMTESEQRAGIFARRFQTSVRQSMTRFVTAGFGVSLVRSIIGDAEKIPGITGEMVAELKKVETGWERFTGNIKGGVGALIIALTRLGSWITRSLGLRYSFPKLFGEEEGAPALPGIELAEEGSVEKIKQAREAIFDLVRRQLSIEERRAAVEKELEQPGTPLRRLELIKELLSLRDEKTRREGPQFATSHLGAGSLDPLARIGGFTGGADVKMVTIQERIARATEETAENTSGQTVRFR